MYQGRDKGKAKHSSLIDGKVLLRLIVLINIGLVLALTAVPVRNALVRNLALVFWSNVLTSGAGECAEGGHMLLDGQVLRCTVDGAKLESAAIWLKKASTNEPSNKRLLYQLANVHVVLGQISEAEIILNHLLLIAPHDRLTYLALGHVRLLQSREADAQIIWRRIDLSKPLLQLGIYAINSLRDKARALLYFQAATQSTDAVTVAAAWDYIGNIFREEANYSRALESYREAVVHSPDNVTYRFKLATMYNSLGDRKRARREIEEALQLPMSMKERINAYKLLGSFYLYDGLVDQASTTFDKALALSPDNPDLLARKALVMRLAGDLRGSVLQYQKALAHEQILPDAAGVYEELGETYLALQCVDEAISVLSKAVNLDPDRPSVYFALARAWSMRGRLDLAVTSAREAVRLAPEQERFRRALLELESGRPIEPLIPYNKLCGMEGSVP